MTEILPCNLEIDHERGVIYVHAATEQLINRLSMQTLLRIQGLPPVPVFENAEGIRAMLDINFSSPWCSWGEGGEDVQ